MLPAAYRRKHATGDKELWRSSSGLCYHPPQVRDLADLSANGWAVAKVAVARYKHYRRGRGGPCLGYRLPARRELMLMKYRLYTPGPTSVPEATLLELAKPVHHHRTGEFRTMFAEVQSALQYVYQTKQTVYTITGSGTAAAEAGIVNCLAAGPEGPVHHQRQVRRALGEGLLAVRHRAQGPQAGVRPAPPRAR